MVVVTFACWLMVAAGASPSPSVLASAAEAEPGRGLGAEREQAEASRAAALSALAALARRHPDRFPRLLSALAAAAVAPATDKDGDAGGGTEFGIRALRWETPPQGKPSLTVTILIDYSVICYQAIPIPYGRPTHKMGQLSCFTDIPLLG